MFTDTGHLTLTKQFGLLSFACILTLGTLASYLMSHFFTEKILERDATVSKEFVESIIEADGTWFSFTSEQVNVESPMLQKFFKNVATMPDVVRANIYGRDYSIIWSNSPEIMGKRFEDNEELKAALNGEMVYESGIIGSSAKDEHIHLGNNLEGVRFIETYIPIWNLSHTTVLGVVEVYKLPRALQQSIVEGIRLIWINAMTGGLLLFVSLFWIVKRASLVMAMQQERLLEARSFTMIGKTTSAIAHAMRNPLASIRVCAELTLTDDLEGARESAMDIISETDRLDRWARDLLHFSTMNNDAPEELEINTVVSSVLKENESALTHSEISLRLDLAEEQLVVKAHSTPLIQVLSNLIMNAVEAMEGKGELTITTSLDSEIGKVIVCIRDNGPGLAKEVKDRLFRPFTTTKPTGTGLGLALSRHLLEHYNSTLDLYNEKDKGVTAQVCLPVSKK
ncbi:MAG: ATP-binding protein [Desulforhopalus sp.]